MKIISLNIANYDDHAGWEQRRVNICNLLTEEQPELVSLQEVRFNPHQKTCHDSYQNSAEELLALLHSQGKFIDYHIITMPTMYYPVRFSYPDMGENVIWEGKSIITNLNVLEYGNFLLKKAEDSKDMNRRSIFWCRLKLAESDFVIGNLHWGLDEAARISNAAQTVELSARFTNIPLIIAGDYNTDPEAFTQQQLTEAGLTDLWLISGHKEAGATYPAHAPVRRIDQAWGNQETVQRFKSISIPDDNEMSDHLALCIELELK